MVECKMNMKGKIDLEPHFHITTIEKVNSFAYAMRTLWGTQNSLYWILNVTSQEDDSRIRKSHEPGNFNIIRQLAINLLKQEPYQNSVSSVNELKPR